MKFSFILATVLVCWIHGTPQIYAQKVILLLCTLMGTLSWSIPTESRLSDFSVKQSPRESPNLQIQHATKSAPFLEDTFILYLINQQRLSECSLFILQDRDDNGASVDRILQSASVMWAASTPKSAYSVKFNNISQESLKINYSPVKFPITVSNYRKKSDPCLVVIIMLNDIRPEFMKQIFCLITPVYIPITRKDEDLYIFKTETEKHERLLLMPELPSRIKFKIAIGANQYHGDGLEDILMVKVRTICFFCDPGGNPRLLELPVAEQNLPVSDTDYFPDFVQNLNGKLLHVSCPRIGSKIEVDPPWKGISNAKRGNWKTMFEVFLTIKFNFTYNIFTSTGKDGKFGGGGTGLQLPNGTWIGVVGDIFSHKADLGIVTANTPKRILYVDFTNSFFDIGYLTFVTAQPSRLYSPAALLWPFDVEMWSCIIASTILSILFFFSTFKILEICRLGSERKWSLTVQLQFLLSTFLDQDFPIHPESQVLRSFVGFWFFFTMILTTVYRSKMVTLLAFPVLGELPETFEQLAFSDYKVGFLKHGDSAYNTLAASTDPVYVKLINEMEIIRGVGMECLEKVVKERYGCIAYNFGLVHVRARNLSESDTNKLVFAPVTTYNIWMGLATEGKSIYRLNFGTMLSYARSFHLADIWETQDMYYNVRVPKLDWWKRTNQSDKSKRQNEELNNLNLKNIAGAFYVLIACFLIACVAFLQENFSRREKLRRGLMQFNVFTTLGAATRFKRKAEKGLIGVES